MKFCYVDESMVPGEDEWFYLGGFIVDLDDALRLEDIVDEALDLNWVEQIEMETLKDLRRGDVFEVDRRRELSDNLYETLDEEISYTVCVVAVHQESLEKLKDDVVIYIQIFKLLIERFQFLLSREEEYGIIYIDSRDTDEDIQEAHYRLQRKGTQYLDFDNIVGVSAPIRDEFSRGIQLADLTLAGVRAHLQGLNSRYYRYIFPHMDRNPTDGSINGTGIKVFPKEAIPELEYHPDDTDF